MIDQEKLTAIYALCENFNKTPTENLVDLWLDLLQPYSNEQVKSGVLHVIRTYEFKTLPPFAILKKAIDHVSGIPSIETLKKVSPVQAWLEISLALEYANKDNCPQFPPRSLHALQRIGGWYYLCLTHENDLKWKEKAFLEIYENALNIPEEALQINSQQLLELPKQPFTGIINALYSQGAKYEHV